MNNEQLRNANRSAAIRWGGFVVALLSLQVAGGAWAIYLATGDPSVAVVPDYHEKALKWDQHVELEKLAAELNWNVQLDVAAGEIEQGLVIQIKDDRGQYVQIQRGELRLYHHARAGNVLRVPVKSTAAEPIVIRACFARPGLWQVELDLVDSSGNRFVGSRSVDVKSSGQPQGTS